MAWPAMCWPTRNTVDFEQGAPDQLAAAGLRPLLQRREHRDDTEHAAQDVDHRSAGAQRLPGRPGHVREPGHELDHLVERRPLLVRAGQEPFERQVNEARVQRRELLVAAAEPLHGSGAVVLDHDVGIRDEAVDQRLPLRRS